LNGIRYYLLKLTRKFKVIELWGEALAIFQYEVFLSVVESGSFTKAGEKLGLSIKDWLTSGTVDIGFLTLPERTLDTIRLLKDELFVLVPEDHQFSTMQSVQVGLINNEAFIMPKAGCDVLIKGLFREKNIHPNVIFEIEDNNTIIALVQEGLGITIIPEMILLKTIIMFP
jgi:DNA-binding transcriptional LysR family regulator